MKKRLLITDDKEQDRYLLKILLENSGYSVDEASNGAEALAAARRSAPDLIITDILMPVMDGFNLCREWHKDDKLRSVPFIFYSATYSDPRDEDLAMKLGADKFIVKPIEPSVLLDRIVEALAAGRASPLDRKPVPSCADSGFFKLYSEALVRKMEDNLELFRTIFNIDPSMILLLSSSGTIVEINQSAIDILGVKAEEAIENNFSDRFVKAEDRPLFAVKLSEALSGVAVRGFESSVINSGGSSRLIRWNARTIVRASEKNARILFVGSDITEIRKAEQRRKDLEIQLQNAQRMEAIGAFASGITHDFNNILTGITGYVELVLQDLPLDSPDREYLVQALTASGRAKRLIQQILSIARQRAGADFKPVDITIMVKEVAKLLGATVPAHIFIELDTDSEACTILGEPSQIHQLLMNLCINAYHALEARVGTIRISCRREPSSPPSQSAIHGQPPESKGWVVVEVRDTGCGMSKTTKERMYDSYFTTKEEGKGTGLGLTVVKKIVNIHHGRIECESKEGYGTVFRVFFPEYEEATVSQEDESEQELARGRGKSVLLVEYDETNGPMLREALQKLEYRIAFASNGMEAIRMFKQSPNTIDLVLTELDVPFMTGHSLIEQVRSIRPAIPVVIIYDNSESVNDEYFLSLEVSGFLRKPFSIEQMARTLKKAWSGE